MAEPLLTPDAPGYRPDPRIRELGDGFFDPVQAAAFPELTLRFRNDGWAARIGLGDLDDTAWVEHLGRFRPLPGNLEQPLALRYHGHQFGSYNPHLGDGRGFLHAQLRDPDERLLDLGTKGSGTTPWSRGGDGRLTLKGGVREILATEMLEALGVYTSKTLSLIETGEALERHDEPSPTRASVLVRLSHGHVRFGSFQRHAHGRDAERLARLVDYCIAHLVPVEVGADEAPAVALLREVARRTAVLAASWMAAGFVHGVLNTDNMNVTGESFDYGPYRFAPTFDPRFVAAYFDHGGLYAFGRQPEVCLWNLERLADALAPIADRERLTAALADYGPRYEEAFLAAWLRRLGVCPLGDDLDRSLVRASVVLLAESELGFEQLFFDWYGGRASKYRALSGPAARCYAGTRFETFRELIERYEASHPERLADPYFEREVPETLLIDELEAIWRRIAEDDDWSALEAKVEAIRRVRDLFGFGPTADLAAPFELAAVP